MTNVDENILEKDLEEIYTNLSPAKRREFKLAGEKTASQINLLLDKAKFKLKKIIDLLK